jgi:ABC-type nitrate/sulfonate/bicarbonate transport system substrate-binding protein
VKGRPVLELSRRSLILAGSAAAAQYALRGPAGAQTMTKLRVAAVPIDISSAVFYAQSLGNFKKRNLDVELVVMANGPATAAAVMGGSLDFGTAAVAPQPRRDRHDQRPLIESKCGD